jgi:hypothetical protein
MSDLYGGITEDAYKECMLWAFGVGWEGMRKETASERWNKYHPDLFTLNGTEDAVATIKRIQKAWHELGEYEFSRVVDEEVEKIRGAL